MGWQFRGKKETNPGLIAGLEVRKCVNVCMVDVRVISSVDKLPDWTTKEWLWRVSFSVTIWVMDFIVQVSGWLNDRVSPCLNTEPHRLREWPTDRMTEWSSYWLNEVVTFLLHPSISLFLSFWRTAGYCRCEPDAFKRLLTKLRCFIARMFWWSRECMFTKERMG